MFLDDSVCIVCGCTDHNACSCGGRPCSWVLVDYHTGTGLCSACVDKAVEKAMKAGGGMVDAQKTADVLFRRFRRRVRQIERAAVRG